MLADSVKKPTIMIVDDEWLNRELLQGVLELYAYDTMLAASGKQALDLAQQHCPDLVLLDVRMPDMDGYEVTRSLKADTRTKHAIVILMSGLEGNHQERKQATEAGAVDFISRTMPVDDLVAYIERLTRSTPDD